MYNLLTEDTLDAILTSLPPSEIEERTYYFSHNAYPLGPVLNLSDETTVKSWQDLTEKIVGVYAFSPTILQLQKIYNIKLRLNDDIKQAFQDLENHIIDAAIYPALPSITYINTFYSNKLKVVSNVLNNEGIHLVTLNNDEGKKIIDIFNQGLKQVKEDGLLNQLLERWNLVDTTALEENVNFEAIEKMHG